MSDTVIRVENLGKKYIVGHQQQECSNLSWENQSQLCDGTWSLTLNGT